MSNPYGGQRDPSPAGYGQEGYNQTPYGAGGRGYNQPQSIDGGYPGQNVEMASLTQNAGGMARSDPNAIRNECRDISNAVRQIESDLEQIKMVQMRVLSDVDSSSNSQSNRQLDALTTETMATYRSLAERVRIIKSNPEGRSPMNNGHVERVDREVKAVITKYQTIESDFQANVKKQIDRQYRIVRPDATEDEVRAAVDGTGNQQIFSQALMQSDRQGRARAALTAVQDRHKELLKIEQQMTELFQLMQDLDTLVVQQDAAVIEIEQKAEEVVEHLDKGNEEIGVAVKTARATRKKKWICLGICVAIIVVIIIIVLIYIFVIRGNNSSGGGSSNNAKRALSEALQLTQHAVPAARREVADAAQPGVAAQILDLATNKINHPVRVRPQT
ncbi:Syntaxin-like protein psy1 [Escovopsis weberi]|uniref:Syntaxin-like protein psy1 n=1 Tax=Escovopsis weberi TaxID=150374 RepID=A0A0M9VU31_ESCWE|nr:Syntaxin-like protein psy1 [Escovopsis weberi]